MAAITMQELFERDLITGSHVCFKSQTWPVPTFSGPQCLRACGNEAQAPSVSQFQLCEECCDKVFDAFIRPIMESPSADAYAKAYRKVEELYGWADEEL